MLGYVEKPLQRMKHLIIATLTFEICCSNVVFLVKMINNMQNRNYLSLRMQEIGQVPN